jgi:hypothetical protein
MNGRPEGLTARCLFIPTPCDMLKSIRTKKTVEAAHISRTRGCVAGFLVLVHCLAAAAVAESARPFRGVELVHEKLTEPRLIDVHVVKVELGAPDVRFQVTGPSLPGESKLTTTRDALAAAKATDPKARLAVNAAFFSFSPKAGIFPPYCYIEGIAASEGRLYSVWEEIAIPFPAFNISRSNVPSILDRTNVIRHDRYASAVPDNNIESWQIAGALLNRYLADHPDTPDDDISGHFYNAISGSHRLVMDGTNTMDLTSYPKNDEAHPRTGIGYGGGFLIIVTVDGRNPGHSLGVTTPELADLLIKHGAVEAVNWDGGGSTTLVIADPAPRLLNIPVGIKGRAGTERPVGASLIIFAEQNDFK